LPALARLLHSMCMHKVRQSAAKHRVASSKSSRRLSTSNYLRQTAHCALAAAEANRHGGATHYWPAAGRQRLSQPEPVLQGVCT
jgi:hypothetical protein